MVIDTFTYNGESDILELHLDMLYPFVDRFIIVESEKTFNGTSKPLYFELEKDRFKKWADKITYYPVPESEDYPNDTKLLELADSSPNVPKGMEHWRREFYKKELIKNALVGLDEEDIVIVGDVDETLHPAAFQDFQIDVVLKYRVQVYVYYLNNQSDEVFYGPIVSKYKNIKNGVLNHLRQWEHIKIENPLGWHFTNMGGEGEIMRKVKSSYDEMEYTVYAFSLNARIENNVDYLGRKFKFTTNENKWPKYLKENREKYLKLIK